MVTGYLPISTGDHVLIAVYKQKGLDPVPIKFSDLELLPVAPPSSEEFHYELSEDAQPLDEDYPLHDSSMRVGVLASVDV